MIRLPGSKPAKRRRLVKLRLLCCSDTRRRSSAGSMLNPMGMMVLHAPFEGPSKFGGRQPADLHDTMRFVHRLGDRRGDDHQGLFRQLVVTGRQHRLGCRFACALTRNDARTRGSTVMKTTTSTNARNTTKMPITASGIP